MKIVVPRIADATQRRDLTDFANSVLQKWFHWPFSEHPRVNSCRILSIENSMGVTQRHGLLEVTPDAAAIRMIRKLNGAFLCGKRVGVKQYDAAAARAISRV